MPGGMAGDELAREAQSLRPGIRVLLASGYATRMAKDGQDRGGFPILQKPYKRAELAAHLRALLDGAGSPHQ